VASNLAIIPKMEVGQGPQLGNGTGYFTRKPVVAEVQVYQC